MHPFFCCLPSPGGWGGGIAVRGVRRADQPNDVILSSLRCPALGEYRVTLRKTGFSPKRSSIKLPLQSEPRQFRLLSDGLIGYMWPKWCRAGEKSEFRVHAADATSRQPTSSTRWSCFEMGCTKRR